jgi:hypothetical protein
LFAAQRKFWNLPKAKLCFVLLCSGNFGFVNKSNSYCPVLPRSGNFSSCEQALYFVQPRSEKVYCEQKHFFLFCRAAKNLGIYQQKQLK